MPIKNSQNIHIQRKANVSTQVLFLKINVNVQFHQAILSSPYSVLNDSTQIF
jgi:hypothetical protein